jgi:acetate kinase
MSLLLIANPGSASRKYALVDDKLKEVAALHIEQSGSELIATLRTGGDTRQVPLGFTDISQSAAHLYGIFNREHLLESPSDVRAIGLRIVAPSNYFLKDRLVDDDVVQHIRDILPLDPIHVSGTLQELEALRSSLPTVSVALISDSAFHARKPSYAWNYGINLQDADHFEIKRFGYHGLSVSSAVNELWNRGKLPPKVVVCHLGSGSSVSAVFHGRSIDNTMGYSALEGVIMATRTGSIDYTAAMALKTKLGLDDDQFEHYLDEKGGLLGLSGTSDIREILDREANGDHIAHLALMTLIHSIHKAIGAMVVAMNGADLLVFTGTVGERSANLRRRIVAHLECLDFILDGNRNKSCLNPTEFTSISQAAVSKPIIVIPTDEGVEIARHTVKLLAS